MQNNPKPGNYWIAAEQVPPDRTAAAQLHGAGVGNGADALGAEGTTFARAPIMQNPTCLCF